MKEILNISSYTDYLMPSVLPSSVFSPPAIPPNALLMSDHYPQTTNTYCFSWNYCSSLIFHSIPHIRTKPNRMTSQQPHRETAHLLYFPYFVLSLLNGNRHWMIRHLIIIFIRIFDEFSFPKSHWDRFHELLPYFLQHSPQTPIVNAIN